MRNLLPLIKWILFNTVCLRKPGVFLSIRAFGIRTFAALGLCERKHIQFLEQIVRPGSTAIDVVANCGVYAVALSQRVGKEINDAVLADRTHAFPALTREAEGVRFELTRPFSLPVFKTGAINRSATPPGIRDRKFTTPILRYSKSNRAIAVGVME